MAIITITVGTIIIAIVIAIGTVTDTFNIVVNITTSIL